MNFFAVIRDVHMKYPVIIRKQFVPAFPNTPRKSSASERQENGSEKMTPPSFVSPELTT